MKILRGYLLILTFSTIVAGWCSADSANRLPGDIVSYKERREMCSHWGSEEPYNAARAKQIRQAVKDEHCYELDRDEKHLKKKYRRDPKVLEAIEDAKNVMP